MSEIHGITGAPYQTPGVRKKLPAPFVRPSITVGGAATAVKRCWKEVSVFHVKVGDTVADFGLVSVINEFIAMPEVGDVATESDWRVRLHNVMGDHRDYPGHDRVYAFSRDHARG